MKRVIMFVGGVVCGFVVGSSLRCGLVGRAMYSRGYQAGVAKVQAEAIANGYAEVMELQSWTGGVSNRKDVRREFHWKYPGTVEGPAAGTPER